MPRHGFGQRNDVCHTGLDGAPGHILGLGAGRVLYQGHPPFLLDSAQAEGAVRSHTGKNDPDSRFLAIFRQRAKKIVDR